MYVVSVSQMLEPTDHLQIPKHRNHGSLVIAAHVGRNPQCGNVRHLVLATQALHLAINFEDLLSKSPTAAIEYAVKGMLPKGPLGRAMFKKLKVYSGPQHEHSAQQPLKLELS